jgi:thymidylate kinase
MSNLHCNDIVLLDEGFLQRGNAIFCPPTASKEMGYDAVQKYLQAIPTPDLIVLLDISVTESEKRINRRDDGPPRSFSGQNRSEILDRLNRMKRFTEYVRSAAQELSIPISCIENEGPMEDTVAEIETQLKKML